MGLAELFTRNITYQVTDTETGSSDVFTVVTDGGPGMFADWSGVEYEGGMGLPGAWRASLLLADLIGGVPWHAYRTRDGRPARMEPTPPLLEQPHPPDPRVATFTSLALDLIWHGNALALIAGRTRDGWPTALLPLRAENVQAKRIGLYDDAPLPVGTLAYQVGGRWYRAEDMVHVKGPCRPGALRGMGVLENHLRRSLSLADEQARQARSLGTSGVPTGVLTVEDTPEDPLDQEEADTVKAGWLRSQRDRTVAVLNARTKFEPLSWNPTETQLLDARKFSLHEIALIFGLDPSWLGVAGDSMTYSNIEQQAVNLVRYSLMPHLVRFEQTLSLHLPRGTEAKANLDALLRADTKTRYEAHAIALASGFLTADEVREMEDRPPLTPAQREAARPPAPAPRPAAPGPTDATPDDETDA